MKPIHRGLIVFCLTGSLVGYALGSIAQTPTTIKVVQIKKVQVVKIRVKKEIITREMGARDYAKELLTSEQYKCLDYLATKESHWNPKSKEHSTKAFGIGQLLPSTWDSLNYKQTKNANAQILAMLVYIARHYGSSGVCGASGHSRTYGWY